ncbi:molybdopterin synthase [Halostella sp. JP-L12]|uniref:molybdopterin synthase n=1 Tax=Halostella TaxID=1843185 RepID=UPI000EF825ED|nr:MULTISPECIES: molybdopterin synthase [Halostella]NHN46802.1 molybdopterin synthase [Halostella sp. JP-L12]
MKVLGVVGPSDSGKTTLVERLTERLASDATVATVKHLTHEPDVDAEGKDTARHRAAGAASTYGITDEGDWFATGDARSLGETLDELAPDHDYAVVEGFSRADLPQVVLGGREHRGPTLATGDTAGDVDLDEVVEALRDVDPHVTLSSLVARAKRSPDAEKAGAVATFTGRVRAKDHDDDEPTELLEFEKYEGVAEDRLDALRAELEEREGVYEVLLHHRTGVIEYGEDIVFVVVLAGHRKEAFRTVEDGIDRLKEEVPIFKKEVTVEDEFWVHER